MNKAFIARTDRHFGSDLFLKAALTRRVSNTSSVQLTSRECLVADPSCRVSDTNSLRLLQRYFSSEEAWRDRGSGP